MRVLLAEDEVTIFVTLRDALEDAGHEVLGATDTKSALDALEVAPAPEAVALIDRRQAWQFAVVPLRLDDGELTLCTSVEYLPRAMRFAGWRLGERVSFVLAEREDLGRALETAYPMGAEAEDLLKPLLECPGLSEAKFRAEPYFEAMLDLIPLPTLNDPAPATARPLRVASDLVKDRLDLMPTFFFCA